MTFEPGGAALLGRLISAVADDIQKRGGNPIEVRTIGWPERPTPADREGVHSFAIWSRHDQRSGAKDGPKAWRISEALGIQDIAPAAPLPQWPTLVEDTNAADLVVLDAGLGGSRDRTRWPMAITAPDAAPWVVLKMARPVGEGELWEHLISRHASRLAVVVRVNDLRVTEAQISRELSWERTAQDLLWELTYNPEVKRLSRCAHLIVSFGTSGALLLSNREGGREARLFFDPPVMEEEWAEQHPGGMMGYTVCLTASVARQILLAPDKPDMGQAIASGLGAMRDLHEKGYEVLDPSAQGVSFPAVRIAEAMADESTRFADVLVREPAISAEAQARPWTILEDVFTDGLEKVARDIVVYGSGQIVSKVPVARFGKLLTVHRTEIEGYRSVRSLIAQYARQSRPERPLSIAVFGRPGSGKSFGIKQIALSLFPGWIEPLTFNLSQFNEPEQLLDAFHQVRDQSLKGKLPLVFWDEFDARLGADDLGWLKYFLAPMQDGEFQEGQVTHHIGPAIFVFAGGTKERMEDFGSQESEAFRNGKGRDFVSRLKGYVNVLGPNPIGSVESDPHYVIRRAILLRSMLESKKDLFVERDGKRQLQIDGGVLRAFLRVSTYVHGARSMESVIAMSLLDDASRYERSCLPSAEQLGIHVGPDFLDIVRSLAVEGRMLRELAEAAHVVYCANMLADGWTWGETSDDYLKLHELLKPFEGRPRDPSHMKKNLVPYESLSDDVMAQNEGFARDIPSKVETIGYQIVLGHGDEGEVAFPHEVIELLAEQEHDRWVRLKLRQGWSWGPKTDPEQKLHPDMLPWGKLTNDQMVERFGLDAPSRLGTDALPEKDREKDRALIRAVTKVLAENGYRVTKRAAPAR
jgi:hypothetical protein